MYSLEEIRKQRAATWASQKKDRDVVMLDSASMRSSRSRSPRKKGCELKILTWNIDGLDNNSNDEDMLGRTLWVVKQISELRPHIVFLQELVDLNYQILARLLGKSFHIYVQENAEHPYFVAILVSKQAADGLVGKPEMIKFPTSKMGRAAIFVSVRLQGFPTEMGFITSHLESLRESSNERRDQLSMIDAFIRKRSEKVIFFGGDLNIRDNEVPGRWKDCWIIAGKDKAEEFTWDLSRNSNAKMPNGSQPRCRFDRMYIFDESNVVPFVEVKKVQLVGTTPVDGLEGRFASDHFGVLTTVQF